MLVDAALVHGDLYNKGSLMPLLLQKSPKLSNYIDAALVHGDL